MSRSEDAGEELTEVFNDLWRLDVNRLRPGTDYIIDLQVRYDTKERERGEVTSAGSNVRQCFSTSGLGYFVVP
uniref:Uncharacterized protein n=1 Tax=Knipowitschia caucasica TaxID=637954 RepID=A0AAV2JWD5_KNICA